MATTRGVAACIASMFHINQLLHWRVYCNRVDAGRLARAAIMRGDVTGRRRRDSSLERS
jgi:hypothetical protein